MKKYNISLLLLLALFLGSCSDYLDKAPEGVVDQEDVDYSNVGIMFQPVSGIYATARTENGFSRWALFGMIAVRADDTNKGGPESDQADFTLCKEFKYDQIRDYWALNASWSGLYNLIQKSNEALISLDKFREYITTEDNLRLNAQYKAEVRFIRAYTYFMVSRLWGDIPLILSVDDVINNKGKTPRTEVYQFINDELDLAIADMPELRPNEMPFKGQVTKFTALALKAKVNADINKWEAVLDATQQIIDSKKFKLFDNYYEYFKKPGKLSDETLFELQYTDFGTPSGEAITSDNWFAFQGPGKITGAQPISGGWGFATPSAKIVQLFKDRGEKVRFETTFLMSNSITPEGDQIGDNLHPAYNGKAYLPSTQLTEGRREYGIGNNIRMIRYADVLLLNAEAKVRLGQNGDESLNEVRRRAQMDEITNATLDQILEERQVEFACEWGERFFDLVRTDRAASTLPLFKKGESEFYPIPQEQINLNPLLK